MNVEMMNDTVGLRQSGGAVDYRARMHTDGYVVIPGALSPLEIGHLRGAVRKYLDESSECRYLYDGKAKAECFCFDGDDVYLPLLANARIADALRAIVGGDVVFANEIGLGADGASGWHKDTHGQADLFDRARHADFGVYKVLVYPQDQLGRDDDDFALRVKRGSHWLSSCQAGEEDRIFVRAGDAIVIDVRTSHRGVHQLGETWDIARRAAYYPVRHLAPAASYRVRQAYRHFLGRTSRQLVTLLYGRPNSFTTTYVAEGQRDKRERWASRADVRLPDTWRRALESVSIKTL